MSPSQEVYPGILLGIDLAAQLSADLGDTVSLLSPQANTRTALGGGTVSRTYVVSGIFETGLFNYDARWAVVRLAEGRKFLADYDETLDEENYVTGVAMNLPDPWLVDKVAKRIAASDGQGAYVSEPQFADLIPLTWQTTNKSLLFALKLEKFAMGSILLLIVVVAAFSISGTMMMTVFHKRGQVSLFRSLGMDRSAIARLFLVQGFTIGTVGIVLGLALGLGACALIDLLDAIELPSQVYKLEHLPVRWLWVDYGIICGSAWVLSLIAATYPALTAARQHPGRGLRYL